MLAVFGMAAMPFLCRDPFISPKYVNKVSNKDFGTCFSEKSKEIGPFLVKKSASKVVLKLNIFAFQSSKNDHWKVYNVVYITQFASILQRSR